MGTQVEVLSGIQGSDGLVARPGDLLHQGQGNANGVSVVPSAESTSPATRTEVSLRFLNLDVEQSLSSNTMLTLGYIST
jgi:hypothetical protein